MVRLTERLTMWLAWRLPRRVAYWAFVRVAVDDGGHVYGGNPAEREVIHAMKAWDQ